MAFHPDGRSVWFPNQGANAVTRVDVPTWTVSLTIRQEAFVEPHGVVFTPDGGTVYVTSHGLPLADPGGGEVRGDPATMLHLDGPRANGTVVVIDAATGRVRMPDQRVTIEMLVAEGDKVAGYGTYAGTHTGQVDDIPPTGRRAELMFLAISRIEDGKIAEMWVEWDNLAMLMQLGLFPPSGPPGGT